MPNVQPNLRPTDTKTINLALQGGGAHGAFGWGVLDRLLEDGRVEIEGFSATSAGAMNAVVYAYGKMKGGQDGARALLETFWRRISVAGRVASPVQATPFDFWLERLGIKENLSYRAFETMTHLFSPYEFNPFGFNPLKDILRETVDFEDLHSCTSTTLRICATNVRNGSPKIFTNENLSVDAVLASACLPMLFKAVDVDGEAYWDGGYIGNPAIYPLIYDTKSADILIVHINPIVRGEVPTRSSEILNRINEISFNSSLLRELRAIAFATKLIDDDWIKPEFRTKLKRLFLHSIRTDDIMQRHSVASKFDTSWSFLTMLRDQGRQLASQWLVRHFDDLNVRSTIDIQRDYL